MRWPFIRFLEYPDKPFKCAIQFTVHFAEANPHLMRTLEKSAGFSTYPCYNDPMSCK